MPRSAFGAAGSVWTGRHISATPDTVFQWMSLTKTATAMAIIQLQERAALNLDDAAVKHLPFFKVQYPSEESEQVTIWHLLNHSSGLANPPWPGLVYLA
jgi:CubicO group peptidase (beta-lactamase class C family)